MTGKINDLAVGDSRNRRELKFWSDTMIGEGSDEMENMFSSFSRCLAN